MNKEELKQEAEEYLHENYCYKGSYCGFNAECKEGVRIRCSEFEILEKHIINFAEPKERRIAELEATNKKISDECHKLVDTLEKKQKDVVELEKENKCQRDKIMGWSDEWTRQLALIKELEKENAELKADNDARKFAMAMSEKVEKQLREENEKLKTDYKVLSCSVDDFEVLQDKLEEEQRKNNGLSDDLTKAKEILHLFFELKTKPCASGNSINMLQFENTCKKAEQFLSEVVGK